MSRNKKISDVYDSKGFRDGIQRYTVGPMDTQDLERIYQQARDEERERCAKVAEAYGKEISKRIRSGK